MMKRMERLHKMNVRIFAWAMSLILLLSLCACSGGEDPLAGSQGTVYSFTAAEGVTLTPGAKAAEALAALAHLNPTVSAGKSCLGGVDGEDVTYVYPGFRVQTFRLSEGHPDEEIRWVILSDDSVKTAEGAAIGDAAEAVRTIYGEPAEASDTLLTYLRGGVKLRFALRDGVVKSIEYTVAE